jgi:signal peptidase I
MPEKRPSQTEHVRETADSIVVAFILAFVFRAFVIEAFVIPTGSMAATLYGRHGTMICHDCGWEFAYGLSDPSSQPRDRRAYAAPEYGPNELAACPNCGHGSSIAEINDSKGNSEAGDRILALKWPYDVGGERLGPHRWDVTLFKDPSDNDLNDSAASC